MGKQVVCDFCGAGAWNKIKVRGNRWAWVPGMFSPAIFKLWLCNNCYDNLIEITVAKTSPQKLSDTYKEGK